jgi:hypothetical protein
MLVKNLHSLNCQRILVLLLKKISVILQIAFFVINIVAVLKFLRLTSKVTLLQFIQIKLFYNMRSKYQNKVYCLK